MYALKLPISFYLFAKLLAEKATGYYLLISMLQKADICKSPSLNLSLFTLLRFPFGKIAILDIFELFENFKAILENVKVILDII